MSNETDNAQVVQDVEGDEPITGQPILDHLLRCETDCKGMAMLLVLDELFQRDSHLREAVRAFAEAQVDEFKEGTLICQDEGWDEMAATVWMTFRAGMDVTKPGISIGGFHHENL